jgi:Ca-activated chloride channel family protein
MYISFTHPFYLVFLFAIPVLILLHFFGLKNIKGRALNFANFESIARVKGIDLYSKNILLLLFNILLIVLLVFALSGLNVHRDIAASEFSFIIAIDSSESMSAIDMDPNRLAAAKETAIDFVNSLPSGSNVGVISFSGDTYVEQGLTKNKPDIRYAIDNIEIGFVKGTDVFEAVTNSIELLKNEKRKSVILLSDGQINIGNIGKTITYANLDELVIHTLGIGTVTGGETSYGLSVLDEDSLKSLAYNTNGEYFNVRSKQDMKDSFDEIITVTEREGSFDLTIYLIIMVIILFIVKQFLLSIHKIIW